MPAKKPAGARAVLVEGIRPLLPRRWKLHPYSGAPDAINQATVWVSLRSIEKMPEAPQSRWLNTTFTVTIASSKASITEADEDLDDLVLDLFAAIDALPMVKRAGAERVAVNDTYLGFDITVEVYAGPNPSTDKE